MGRMTMKSTHRVLGRSLFPRTAHSFTSYVLGATCAALICLLTRSLTCSYAQGKDVFVYEFGASILYHLNSQCGACKKVAGALEAGTGKGKGRRGGGKA